MNKRIGTIIYNLRTSKEISQQQLADLISCRQASISDWELGRVVPSVVYLLKLNEVFGGKLFEELGKDSPVVPS
jgi:transcriptional regulator with XRE-family HTH domain